MIYENNYDSNEEVVIDIQRIVRALVNKAWIIVLTTVLCRIVSIIGTKLFITPLYQSTAMFYVNNNALSLGDTSFSISSSDITASKSLVDSYIVILNTRSTLNDVIDYAGVDRTYTSIKEMITASSVDTTEIFEVVVTSPDPVEANKIANAISYILPKRISTIVEGTSAKIVDTAVLASKPSSPNYLTNTVLGAFVGMFICVAIIVLRTIFDLIIRNEEDIEQICKYPVLASVPDMFNQSKGNYYGSYYSHDTETKKISSTPNDENNLIGGNISFAATEAYKLLRTKLQFSFADEKSCYVIGVSSAMAGEGKSVTASNIAYSFAELKKKVLLIDCDMRKPSIYKKLKLRKLPGLSNFLIRQEKIDNVIQSYKVKNTDNSFDVITSGNTPPNPVELLNSSRMKEALETFKESYDYIILDLPPVGEVSDAMVASQLSDGMIVVARRDYGNRKAFTNALNQFEFVNSKILGIVLSCATDFNKNYGKNYKSYYGYGKKHFSSYLEKK